MLVNLPENHYRPQGLPWKYKSLADANGHAHWKKSTLAPAQTYIHTRVQLDHNRSSMGHDIYPPRDCDSTVFPAIANF